MCSEPFELIGLTLFICFADIAVCLWLSLRDRADDFATEATVGSRARNPCQGRSSVSDVASSLLRQGSQHHTASPTASPTTSQGSTSADNKGPPLPIMEAVVPSSASPSAKTLLEVACAVRRGGALVGVAYALRCCCGTSRSTATFFPPLLLRKLRAIAIPTHLASRDMDEPLAWEPSDGHSFHWLNACVTAVLLDHLCSCPDAITVRRAISRLRRGRTLVNCTVATGSSRPRTAAVPSFCAFLSEVGALLVLAVVSPPSQLPSLARALVKSVNVHDSAPVARHLFVQALCFLGCVALVPTSRPRVPDFFIKTLSGVVRAGCSAFASAAQSVARFPVFTRAVCDCACAWLHLGNHHLISPTLAPPSSSPSPTRPKALAYNPAHDIALQLAQADMWHAFHTCPAFENEVVADAVLELLHNVVACMHTQAVVLCSESSASSVPGGAVGATQRGMKASGALDVDPGHVVELEPDFDSPTEALLGQADYLAQSFRLRQQALQRVAQSEKEWAAALRSQPRRTLAHGVVANTAGSRGATTVFHSLVSLLETVLHRRRLHWETHLRTPRTSRPIWPCMVPVDSPSNPCLGAERCGVVLSALALVWAAGVELGCATWPKLIQRYSDKGEGWHIASRDFLGERRCVIRVCERGRQEWVVCCCEVTYMYMAQLTLVAVCRCVA